MDWQLPLVLVIVAGAAGYLGRRAWRTWRGKKAGCGGGCSCATAPISTPKDSSTALIPPEQLKLRQRGAQPWG